MKCLWEHIQMSTDTKLNTGIQKKVIEHNMIGTKYTLHIYTYIWMWLGRGINSVDQWSNYKHNSIQQQEQWVSCGILNVWIVIFIINCHNHIHHNYTSKQTTPTILDNDKMSMKEEVRVVGCNDGGLCYGRIDDAITQK